jgi:dolichol-phosphate mannosyltransferase
LESLVPSFEVLLVEDGSQDNSWEIISGIALQDPRFVGIRLSRNFGQHPAISAGLKQSRGEWVVVMDCDLQDRPEEIANLYARAQEGFEQVVAVRHNRQDTLIKRTLAKTYVRILSKLSGRTINPSVGNFGIYHRVVIDAINSLKEQGRTFGLLALWSGFNRDEIEVVHEARPYGKSSYSFRSLLRLGLLGVVSHSDKPLRFTIKFGVYLASVSLLVGVWIVARQLIWGKALSGWSSVMVAIVLMTGVILGSIGIVGLYIAQIFEEVKERPTFIIWKETANSKSTNYP